MNQRYHHINNQNVNKNKERPYFFLLFVCFNFQDKVSTVGFPSVIYKYKKQKEIYYKNVKIDIEESSKHEIKNKKKSNLPTHTTPPHQKYFHVKYLFVLNIYKLIFKYLKQRRYHVYQWYLCCNEKLFNVTKNLHWYHGTFDLM